MKKLYTYFIGFSFILFSCQESRLEENPIPVNLIPQDTFQYVLQDLVVLEAHVQNKYKSIPNYYKILKREGQEIFKKYKLDSTRFDASFEYYGKEQEILSEIYTKISDSLNMRSFTLEASSPSEKDTITD